IIDFCQENVEYQELCRSGVRFPGITPHLRFSPLDVIDLVRQRKSTLDARSAAFGGAHPLPVPFRSNPRTIVPKPDRAGIHSLWGLAGYFCDEGKRDWPKLLRERREQLLDYLYGCGFMETWNPCGSGDLSSLRPLLPCPEEQWVRVRMADKMEALRCARQRLALSGHLGKDLIINIWLAPEYERLRKRDPKHAVTRQDLRQKIFT
ncbi:unnamed protein product, partial [Amoebophrya sp. A25]